MGLWDPVGAAGIATALGGGFGLARGACGRGSTALPSVHSAGISDVAASGAGGALGGGWCCVDGGDGLGGAGGACGRTDHGAPGRPWTPPVNSPSSVSGSCPSSSFATIFLLLGTTLSLEFLYHDLSGATPRTCVSIASAAVRLFCGVVLHQCTKLLQKPFQFSWLSLYWLAVALKSQSIIRRRGPRNSSGKGVGRVVTS